MKTQKPDLSVILVIDQNQGKTTSLKLKTKHLSRLRHYLVSAALIVLAMVGTTIFLSYKNREKEERIALLLQEISRIEQQIPDEADTTKFRRYIQDIDVKLGKINLYLKKRGIQGFSTRFVGGGNEAAAAPTVADSYALYSDYIDKILSGITRTPVGYPAAYTVTSVFGYRGNPFHSGDSEFHAGLDFKGNKGDAVKSTAGGQVVYAGWQQGYGKCVRVGHTDGIETLYGHLSRIRVKSGEQISAGQLIGNIGSTGRSTGYHLHYEVRKNGRPVNPSGFLRLN